MRLFSRATFVAGVIGLGLLVSRAAIAQSVRWKTPDALFEGQPGTIELVFEDCAPEARVTIEEVPGLISLGDPTETRTFSMVNFRSTSMVTHDLPAKARPMVWVTSEARVVSRMASTMRPPVGRRGLKTVPRRPRMLKTASAADWPTRSGAVTPVTASVNRRSDQAMALP